MCVMYTRIYVIYTAHMRVEQSSYVVEVAPGLDVALVPILTLNIHDTYLHIHTTHTYVCHICDTRVIYTIHGPRRRRDIVEFVLASTI